MKIIVTIDDDNGMIFNHRRQSQDKVLRDRIIKLCKDSVLWMNSYTLSQFTEINDNMRVSETFLDDAGVGEYCFVEDRDILKYSSKIEELIMFRWNRRYPGNLHFDFLPENHNMKCIENKDFQGNSHDKISMGVWVRDEV